MRLRLLLALALAELMSPGVRCADFSLRGYMEGRGFAFVGAEEAPFDLDLRIRPRIGLELGRHVGLRFEPEAKYAFGRGNDAFHDLGDALSVERLYADLSVPHVELRIGRQALGWGSGQLFNPTDLFDDVFLADTWAEESGHDALRVSFPFGMTSELTAIVSADDIHEPASALRGRMTLGVTDLSFTLARNDERRESLAGIDLKSEKTIGFWLEAAWIDPFDDDPYLKAIAGADYTFPVRDALYLSLQYYRDGSGTREKSDYDFAAFLQGKRVTLGRDYATLTGRLAWSDQFGMTLLAISNLDDGSLLATMLLEITRFPRLTLSLGGSWFAGQPGGELNPPAGLDPRIAQAVAYTWIRYHF